MARIIEIEDMITVGTLAEKLMLPVSRLIGELMKNGVMATVNERIDFETAQIIVDELGLDVELVKLTQLPGVIRDKKHGHDSAKAVSRPPVVAVMGHVDHGKTSILDAIRGSQLTKQEAGGITQHISSYQVTRAKRPITFLDTPGHEAFAAIREHGAQLTDIAVIVVAADDGVKPQTVEAIRFARKAGVKIIIALNKIDKDSADPARVKQQLAEQDLLIEEWGGDIVLVEVSAKTGQGIDNLLDMILLVAEVEDYRAEIDAPARGLIIEAHLEQGRGPSATTLVEEGTLRVGDFIVVSTTYAKVRKLTSPDGVSINEATPSMPVVITGFKSLPEFGDEFTTVSDEKTARIKAEQASLHKRSTVTRSDMNSSELIRMIDRRKQLQELNIILRADVGGSLTSVIDSLKALDTDEVAVRVVGSGVSKFTESDVHLAATTGAILYGFNITAPTEIKRLASRDKVPIRLYSVIYELIDDAKAELTKLLAPELKEVELGQLVVRGVFKVTKTEIICGGEVIGGKLVAPALARVMRGTELLAEVEVVNLKRGPQDVKEVLEGEMCGVSIKSVSRIDLQEGDKLVFFNRESITRQL